MDRNPEVVRIMENLARPFPDGKVKWKPQAVQGNRAMALAYIDARTVQERLDEVLGPENWQSEFVRLENGSVACKLSIRLAGEWIAKSDVGGESEQPDSGDRTKAAYSDSLKRAAVQFGIGRHLYSLPKQWVDYDPVKRQFVRPPKLPPAKGGGNPPASAPRAAEAKAASEPAQNPPGNPPQHPERSDAKADTPGKAGPAVTRAAQEQIERIDLLIGRLQQKDSRRNAKWLSDSLAEKFGKAQSAELSAEEADKVIAGLESSAKKLGITVVDLPATAKTEQSGTSSAVVSGGKTPPRRGTF